jgi:hypothetical protein
MHSDVYLVDSSTYNTVFTLHIYSCGCIQNVYLLHFYRIWSHEDYFRMALTQYHNPRRRLALVVLKRFES